MTDYTTNLILIAHTTSVGGDSHRGTHCTHPRVIGMCSSVGMGLRVCVCVLGKCCRSLWCARHTHTHSVAPAHTMWVVQATSLVLPHDCIVLYCINKVAPSHHTLPHPRSTLPHPHHPHTSHHPCSASPKLHPHTSHHPHSAPPTLLTPHPPSHPRPARAVPGGVPSELPEAGPAPPSRSPAPPLWPAPRLLVQAHRP